MPGYAYVKDTCSGPSAVKCGEDVWSSGLRKQPACMSCPPGYTTRAGDPPYDGKTNRAHAVSVFGSMHAVLHEWAGNFVCCTTWVCVHTVSGWLHHTCWGPLCEGKSFDCIVLSGFAMAVTTESYALLPEPACIPYQAGTQRVLGAFSDMH